MAGDHRPERLRVDRAHRPGLLPAGFHEEERRQGVDAVRPGHGRRLVDVDIHEPRAAGELLGELPNEGDELPVGPAPLRVEIDHDRDG